MRVNQFVPTLVAWILHDSDLFIVAVNSNLDAAFEAAYPHFHMRVIIKRYSSDKPFLHKTLLAVFHVYKGALFTSHSPITKYRNDENWTGNDPLS
jgi:hypothetical protein